MERDPCSTRGIIHFRHVTWSQWAHLSDPFFHSAKKKKKNTTVRTYKIFTTNLLIIKKLYIMEQSFDSFHSKRGLIIIEKWKESSTDDIMRLNHHHLIFLLCAFVRSVILTFIMYFCLNHLYNCLIVLLLIFDHLKILQVWRIYKDKFN